MLCEKCHTKRATVHFSTVVHPGLHQDQHHLCPECAEAFQTSRPVLNPGAEPLLTAGSKPVMSFSPEAKARVDSVHDKLSELDPIFQDFCARRGYVFRRGAAEWWPAKGATARCEIERRLDLTTDVTFLDLLKRGFYPEMPW